eukprot:CFRG6434T1
MFSLIVSIITLLSLSHVCAQQPIPRTPDGVRYTGDSSAPVQLEIFIDPLCPDSRDAWPIMKDVVAKYASDSSLVVHLFPLPYHRYSFAASQVAASLTRSPKLFTMWIETVFAYQEHFWNDATQYLTTDQVNKKLSNLGPASGLAEASVLDALLTRRYDMELRTSWKYGCSRGVTGTPVYLVNGVNVNPKDNNVAAWSAVIEPLLV